ncbi:MAG: glycosyltransferase [Acidobacteriota bacterium]
MRDTMLSDLERESGLPVTGQPDLSHELVVVFSTLELVGAGRSFDQRFAFVGPALQGRPQDVPFPWDALEPVPRILLSLGTVNAERGARFYRVAADALGDGPIQVVIVAPEALAGTLPGNFLRRDYVPQLALMPHVDAVICHGGHNTTCEALFHGKPLVIAPIKDDQPVVADQVVGAGAGVRVKFGRVNAAGLRDAVRVILEEPSYAAAAARVGASFRAAGGAERAAQVLERLAR